MSLDSEKKNIPSPKLNLKIRPIQGDFKDKDEYGITDTGDVVSVNDRSTWSSIVTYGLPLTLKYEMEDKFGCYILKRYRFIFVFQEENSHKC